MPQEEPESCSNWLIHINWPCDELWSCDLVIVPLVTEYKNASVFPVVTDDLYSCVKF